MVGPHMRIKLSNSLKHSVRESGMLLIQSDFCNHVRKNDSLVLHIPSLRSSTYEMQWKEKNKNPQNPDEEAGSICFCVPLFQPIGLRLNCISLHFLLLNCLKDITTKPRKIFSIGDSMDDVLSEASALRNRI